MLGRTVAFLRTWAEATGAPASLSPNQIQAFLGAVSRWDAPLKRHALPLALGWVQALRTMSVLASVAGQPRAVAARWHDRHGVAVRRAFPSFVTEIYLCHTCSCHEILRVETSGQERLAAWANLVASNHHGHPLGESEPGPLRPQEFVDCTLITTARVAGGPEPRGELRSAAHDVVGADELQGGPGAVRHGGERDLPPRRGPGGLTALRAERGSEERQRGRCAGKPHGSKLMETFVERETMSPATRVVASAPSVSAFWSR